MFRVYVVVGHRHRHVVEREVALPPVLQAHGLGGAAHELDGIDLGFKV